MIQFLRTKIGISLIIVVFIVSFAFFIKLKGEQEVKKSELTPQVTLVANQSVKKALENGQIDTKPWEETLNSLIGSSTLDEKAAQFSQNSTSSTYSDKPLTATDRFAQVFFAKYVELKKSGSQIDETTGVSLVKQLLNDDYGGPEGEKTYTDSDITILDTSTSAAFKNYANSVGEAFDSAVPDGYENELIVVNRANETGKRKDLQKLAQNITHYTKVRQEILDTPTPKALKNAHIAMINALSFVIEGVKGMVLMETDPVGATKMILKYEDGLKSLDLSTRQLGSYFKQQNLKFSSSEPGYIFTE